MACAVDWERTGLKRGLLPVSQLERQSISRRGAEGQPMVDCSASGNDRDGTVRPRLEVAAASLRHQADISRAPDWCIYSRIRRQYSCPVGGQSIRAILVGRQARGSEYSDCAHDHGDLRFIDGIVFAIFAGVVAIAGQLPRVEGNLTIGLGIAGAANLIIFVGILWLLFRHHGRFLNEAGLIGRLIDWIAEKAGSKHGDVRAALAQGIIWPRERMRQQGVIAASFAMKAVSATHYLWAGLALGITLNFFDYLFLMVFAGFALVLSRFIRVPGGFLIGSGFALKLLDVPDEQALAMILFNHIISVVLMVVIGLIVFWQSGIDMRAITRGTEKRDVRG